MVMLGAALPNLTTWPPNRVAQPRFSLAALVISAVPIGPTIQPRTRAVLRLCNLAALVSDVVVGGILTTPGRTSVVEAQLDRGTPAALPNLTTRPHRFAARLRYSLEVLAVPAAWGALTTQPPTTAVGPWLFHVARLGEQGTPNTVLSVFCCASQTAGQELR